MNRRTLLGTLGALATTPLLWRNNNNDSGGNSGGRGLNLSLSLSNEDDASYTELKTQNPTEAGATITADVDAEDYPSGRLPQLTLEPGETQTTGLGTHPPSDYPNRMEFTVVVEWD